MAVTELAEKFRE